MNFLASNRFCLAEVNPYNIETTRSFKSQSLQAIDIVLRCKDLVSKILSFTEPMLDYYKYARVSQVFNSAWMAKNVSMCIITHYDKAKVSSLEKFTDIIFLRRQAINIVQSKYVKYLIGIAPRIVEEEGDARLIIHGTLAVLPWTFLGVTILDDNLTSEQRRNLQEINW
jgi:hypothetical protein